MDVIKNELKYMKKIKFENLLNYIKVPKELNADKFLRPNITWVAILNDTRSDLLSMILLRKMALITKKSFLLNSGKDLYKIIMALITHYDFELHQMNMETAFLNKNLWNKFNDACMPSVHSS